VAAYARTGKHFPAPVVELGLSMADVGDKPHEYDVGQAAFTVRIVWQLLKGWFVKAPKDKAT
jgi:hypothetical protein